MSASAPGSLIERTKAAMRPSSPRSSRISSTTARYSRSSSRMPPSAVSASGCSSTSTKRRPCESEPAAPAIAAVQALESDGATSAREADAVRHLGDGADLRVLVVVLGDEQHALLVADVDGEGDVHVGEDDDVFQGDEQQADRVLVHVLAFGSLSYVAVGGSETVPKAARATSRPRRQARVRALPR